MEDIIIEKRSSEPDMSKAPLSERKLVVKSKKTTIRSKRSWKDFLLSWWSQSLFLSLLLIWDFLAFCSSGNKIIFGANPWNFVPEVQSILWGIAVFVFLFCFISSFNKIIKYIVFSSFIFIFSWSVLHQFVWIDIDSMLFPLAKDWFSVANDSIFTTFSASIFCACVAVFVTFIFFRISYRRRFYFSLLLCLINLILSVQLYHQKYRMADFHVLYEDKVVAPYKEGNNFVYLMVPNLPSAEYFNRMSKHYEGAKVTLKGMSHLLVNNKFSLFSHAYVTKDSSHANLENDLNLSQVYEKKDIFPHYPNVWNINMLKEPSYFAEKNKLAQLFEKNGYVRTVIEDKGVELCFDEQGGAANKCLKRTMTPYQLPDSFSKYQKKILLWGQWLGSMQIFELNPSLYNLFKVLPIDNIPFLGMDYSKINTLGSLSVLDELLEQLQNNKKGNHAYFVWLNLPSKAYVYDEFCQLKPMSEWIVEDGVQRPLKKKKQAYFEQTSCLMGKIADFMRLLKEKKLNKNTVVMLQSLSGIVDGGVNKVDEFKNQNIVTMALYDPKNDKFKEDRKICSTSQRLEEYLLKKKICTDMKDVHLNEKLQKEILTDLTNHQETNIDFSNLANDNEWFRNWLRANYKDMVIPLEKLLPVQEVLDSQSHQKLNPRSIQLQVFEETAKVLEHEDTPEMKRAEKSVPKEINKNTPHQETNKTEEISIKNLGRTQQDNQKKTIEFSKNIPDDNGQNVLNIEKKTERTVRTEKTLEQKSQPKSLSDVKKLGDVAQKKTKSLEDANKTNGVKKKSSKMISKETSDIVTGTPHALIKIKNVREEVVVVKKGKNQTDKILIKIDATNNTQPKQGNAE